MNNKNIKTKIDKARLKLSEPISDNLKNIGLGRQYNVNLNKQISQSYARIMVAMIDTIANCAVGDLSDVLNKMLDDIMTEYEKA